MAEDLKLEIVIQALLDAKGFEEAKQNLGALTETANKAAPVVKATGDNAKRMGESFGGTRGPVADVTRALLQNVGVTGAAGEAAKAAGTAMYFMEGAATALNVAISAGVAAIVFLLPKVIEWLSSTKELEEVTGALNSDLDTQTGSLDRLAGSLGRASEAANVLLVALHAKAMDEDREKLGRMRAEVDLYTQNMRKLGQTFADSPHIIALQQQIFLTEQAHKQNMTYAESLEKAAKANKGGAVSFEESNQILRDEAKKTAAVRARAFDQEMDAELDMIKFTKKADKEKAKADAEEIQRLLDYGRIKIRQIDIDQAAATAKRVEAATVAEMYTSAATMAVTAFSKNKAIAIAAAIADTFAGANKAWAQGGIYAAPMVALIIASGMANVQQIRNQNVGFDDPFADMTARKLGQKSAVDFVRNFAGGFTPGVVAGMGAMGGSTNNTTINRGTTINMGGIHGALGPRPAFDKWLERAMVKAERSRRRTTLGR